MTFSVWLAFAAASVVMGLIPGPGVVAIVGYALGSGRKTALASVAGMTVGNAIAMTLSLVGVGALLAASALAFSVLKWVGALYLIVLGLYIFFKTSRATSAEPKTDAISPRPHFSGTSPSASFTPRPSSFTYPSCPSSSMRTAVIRCRRRCSR
ncbi:LysE family translocator [Methylocystis silviterrae]|uniref:LysE family translocator n=1 Tax=Methylocystis silviterrae TaxID=2743612 RepID=UPI001AED31DC|nr:LysE family translocator [Methylocystis silviterrae]